MRSGRTVTDITDSRRRKTFSGLLIESNGALYAFLKDSTMDKVSEAS
jgi:hypothetical protein